MNDKKLISTIVELFKENSLDGVLHKNTWLDVAQKIVKLKTGNLELIKTLKTDLNDLITNLENEFDVDELNLEVSNRSILNVEKELIILALKKHKNKRKESSIDLGISERTLYRKIKEFNLTESDLTSFLNSKKQIKIDSLSIIEKEKGLITAASEKYKTKRAASISLGISERTIYRKIREYDLKDWY